MAQSTEAPREVIPEAYGTAREYALNRIEAGDRPYGPSELARDYDCTTDHMQHVLADAVEDGDLARVGLGRYDMPGDDGRDEVEAESVLDVVEEADDDDPAEDGESSDENTGEDAEPPRPSAGGGRHSEALDTTGQTRSADDDAPGGIPLPVSQGKFFVGVIVAAVVLFWLVRRSGSSSPSGSSTTQPATDQENDESRRRDSMGGLN